MSFTVKNSRRKQQRFSDHCFIKKTNVRQKPSRYTNENKQQTSTKEIYIENDLQT